MRGPAVRGKRGPTPARILQMDGREIFSRPAIWSRTRLAQFSRRKSPPAGSSPLAGVIAKGGTHIFPNAIQSQKIVIPSRIDRRRQQLRRNGKGKSWLQRGPPDSPSFFVSAARISPTAGLAIPAARAMAASSSRSIPRNAVALPAKGAHNLEGIELSSHSYRSLPSPDCAMPAMACDRSAPRHSLTSMRFSVHERGRHGPARRSGT